MYYTYRHYIIFKNQKDLQGRECLLPKHDSALVESARGRCSVAAAAESQELASPALRHLPC